MKGSKKERHLLTQHFNEANPLKILVITLSDRAHSGEYEDRSGPLLKSHIDDLLEGTGIHYGIDAKVLSDDADGFAGELRRARDEGVHAIFTTGGTGVGPRDNAPDVVMDLADKTIPGIMELIRTKYGADKPNALLSRSVAAILGAAVVYVLPGSTKAVNEYMGEILKTFEHLLCMVHHLDAHE